MAVVIKMPKMSDTMTEGVVRKWNYKVGDTIKSGDILAEVETDKATMDLENFEKGTLLHLAVNEGDAAPVDGILAVVGAAGEDFKSLLSEGAQPAETKEEKPAENKSDKAEGEKPTEKPAEKSTEKPVEKKEEAPAQPIADKSSDSRIKASPLAKKMASDKGIDISAISGSGEGGRITKSDIDNFKGGSKPSTASQGEESFDEINVSQMRKVIAARLSESKFTAPHFYLTMAINMDKAIAARTAMNASGNVKISVNDMIVKACSIALKQHPWVNSSWLGNKIRHNHHINIGVAMAVEEGLLVPVVRFADTKSLSEISKEVKEFSAKAKDKKLQPQDWAGNTFTISNLGMFGIEEFTAIINTPDACILAVGATLETVGIVNGAIAITNVMKVTLSCDHRVVDGVVGSKFLNTVKQLLEEPVMMLV